MPTISQIRLTNVVYEDGQKRYNDDLFKFDGYNGALVLENGGGKTVLIQTLLQAVIPHTNLGERKIRDTLKLEGPAHIAIEWIHSDRPRRYVVTAVSLFISDNKVDSYRYVYEYGASDANGIEMIPFARDDGKRPAERFEINDYYKKMVQQSPLAQTFETIKSYRHFLEEKYHIISDEWDSIVTINQDEGGIERFFDSCKTERHLYDRLLIPTVEKSIAGFDQNRFADIFEERQKSFKLYKELRAQIAEYEAIEGELTAYVNANEVLYKKEERYEKSKAVTKGVYVLAKNLCRETEQEIAHLEQMVEALKIEKEALEARQDAFLIRKKEEELKVEQDQLQELEEERDRIQENIHRLKKRYYSLMFAQQKTNIRVQTELASHFEDEIEKHDEESGTSDLSDDLHTVYRELSGYFTEQQEKMEKGILELTYELRPIENELIACTEERKRLRQQQIDLEKKKTEKETFIQSLEESMRKIRQMILSNTEQETVEARLPQWIQRQTEVDESIVELQNNIKQLRHSRIDVKEKRDSIQEAIKNDSIALAKVEVDVKRMKDAHAMQKEELAQLSFSLSRIDSLYLKQSSVEQDLIRNIERMREEKEEKHLAERLAYRFIDDYMDQDIFFADPFMEQQLHRWANRIGLIDTGIRYLNGLDLSIEEQLRRFPYWPVTLITTADKKLTLIEKIEAVQEKLLYPVHVIDLQEAKALTDGSQKGSHDAILPLYWKENVHTTSFDTWKESLQIEANRITGERRKVEEKLKIWERAYRSYNKFFDEFPYEVLKETEEYEQKLKDQLQLNERLLQRSEKELDEVDGRITSIEQQISLMKDELNNLERRIADGQRHESEASEVVQLKEGAVSIQLDLERNSRNVRRSEQRQKSYEDERNAMHNRIASINMEMELLRRDPYYSSVKDLPPLFTDKTIELLKENAESISRSLNQISESRSELETKMANARERLNEAKVEIKRIQMDWNDFEDIDFQDNWDTEIDKARHLEKIESEQQKKAAEAFQGQEKKVAIIAFQLKELKENFERNHSEVEVTQFTEPLHVVENMLQTAAENLNEQEKVYLIELNRLNHEFQKFERALYELDRFVEAHHFNSASIEEVQLTESDANEFTYNPLSLVHRVTVNMKKANDEVKEEIDRVTNYRHDFNTYVRRNMSDAKMRDNLFQGLEYKRSYKDLVEFQQNIRKKMNSIIRIHEESIRSHDEQLEHFVTHMNEHVRTVVRELNVIPGKTRINFSSGPKRIYNFRITDWEEKEGLARLRAYIGEILEWIEHSRYINPDGKVNNGKIRTDIEKWFETPQLLRVVLQNGDMKVSCRKVTNDNEATSRSFSWRESNEWSGGEKWSKNMTLFLGLLNYVAEKKKLLNTSMKRNRAVVLDNPFGKASSEHVLSPVFFIAEKLGFQIIALTAHAEGKFLRDYFPVIYSCRLRNTRHSEKMIMTKEKTVNAAYFQDHDPAAFDRIGESEQLTLLD
ncbi:hypothetical protein [Sporosarcina ureilytica]|uniref:Uncharacterized protein n=1 Tax=Sporosarcina ureilytica TaxID=298596 RepID=A0A1D8JJ63_9BACL|nr:hypothetical protein [Sporosarcina ureilytica]AOV08748.1 hypothetical protein BI350_15155 [Sporosarcina ureilytica]